MARSLTPSQNILRPGTTFTSIANMSKRTYPLNLLQTKSPELGKHRQSSSEVIPEFIREYIKGAKRPKSKGTIRSHISHSRCKSFQSGNNKNTFSLVQTKPNSKIPYLTYKDYKAVHQGSMPEEKFFIPQIIQISKRSNIILHSSKPISINPGLYQNQKKSEIVNAKSESENIDMSSIYGPRLSYGEKILKLKALVSSNLDKD